MDWFVSKVDQHLFFRLWFEFLNWGQKSYRDFRETGLVCEAAKIQNFVGWSVSFRK